MYRALGNEPGWILEIGPASKLSWTTNYGQDRYDFEQTQATATPDGTNVYMAQMDAVTLKATVKAERCIDAGEVEYDQAGDGGVRRAHLPRLRHAPERKVT